tara:strand:- start:4563 stop:5297 length:735 start_codon:yes stop_codon:yes gene_type:complete
LTFLEKEYIIKDMEFRNFKVTIDNKLIVKDFNYTLSDGTTLVIIGRNGCGKSTLAHAIMGRDDIEVEGKILLDKENILELETFERARKGLFVSWQTPPEIAGVTAFGLIRDVKKVAGKDMGAELTKYKQLLEEVELPSDWAQRQVNVGGSGGERKRAELVNLSSVNPNIAILDEIDTGLDTNGLKMVSKIINKRRENGKVNLVITHNKNLLEHLDFDGGFVFQNQLLQNITSQEVKNILEYGYN